MTGQRGAAAAWAEDKPGGGTRVAFVLPVVA
jgi:hypothetical protein